LRNRNRRRENKIEEETGHQGANPDNGSGNHSQATSHNHNHNHSANNAGGSTGKEIQIADDVTGRQGTNNISDPDSIYHKVADGSNIYSCPKVLTLLLKSGHQITRAAGLR